MKKRTGDPWIPTVTYAHGLQGMSINLLVKEIEPQVRFVQQVLGVQVVYSDPDIAVYQHGEVQWMAHADHTYASSGNPLEQTGSPTSSIDRGGLVELRVHHCDPDAAESRARQLGYKVLTPAEDKPHGLREVYIKDTDGYIWVPDIPCNA